MEQLCSYLSSLVVLNPVQVIVGDFNLPYVDWSISQGSCPFDQAFCDMVFDYNLCQLFSQPTHITGNTLDLVVTTEPAAVEELGVHPASECPMCSDHFMLSFGLQRKFLLQHSPRPTPLWKYDYAKANLEGLSEFLLEADYSRC